MKRFPMLIPLVSITIGIVIGNAIGMSISWALLPFISGIIIFTTISIISKHNPATALRLNSLHQVWIALLFSGCGLVTEYLHRSDNSSSIISHNSAQVMAVVSEIRTTAYGDRITCRIESTYDSLGNLILRPNNINALIYTDGSLIAPGDHIIVPGNFQTITTLPDRRPDGIAEHLAKQGIFLQQKVPLGKIKISGHSEDLMTISKTLRDKLAAGIEKSGLNHTTSAFLIALLLGDTNYLDNNLRHHFASAGIAHILALSGMHVGIIAAIVLWLLLPVNLTNRYKARYILTLILLWIYAFLTGMSPSTVRACLMMSMAFVAIMVERRNNAFNALMTATAIILLVSPYSLWSIGLQLSFLSVAGIILFASPLNPFGKKEYPRLHNLTSAILTSLCATAATWPLTAYYFKSLPILFLPVNLLVLPLLPVYIIIALTHFILYHCGAGTATAFILDQGLEALSDLTKYIDGDGSGTLNIHINSTIAIIWIAVPFIIAIISYSKKIKSLGRKIIISSIVILSGVTVSFVIMPESDSDSIIFQNRLQPISMALYRGGNEEIIEFPSGQCSITDVLGIRIIVADAQPCSDINSPVKCDVLIIGRNCPCNVSQLSEYYDTSLIVSHTSLFKRRRDINRCQANEIGISHHSMPEDGILELTSRE